MHPISQAFAAGLQLDTTFDIGGVLINPMVRGTYIRNDSLNRTMTVSSLAAPGFYWQVSPVDAAKVMSRVDVGMRARFLSSMEFGAKAFFVNSASGGYRGGQVSLVTKF